MLRVAGFKESLHDNAMQIYAILPTITIMTKASLILVLLMFNTSVFCQPKEVSAGLEAKFRRDINIAASKLKEKLSKQELDADQIEFSIDTFKVEQYSSEYIKIDYSTVGMRTAMAEAASGYDSLLNKYYKKLYNKLQPADRQSLVKAQKAWIAFRDAELDLKGTLGKTGYSGGGTIESILQADFYYTIIKKRTIELFEHYHFIGTGLYQ